MSHIQLDEGFQHIISLENLLGAWKEFLGGKRARRDVQDFEHNLMDNVVMLHNDLIAKTYHHSPYEAFNISDPKPRSIHKASVRDRLLHHAVHRVLCHYFSRKFIADSFSCQLGKGTHRALNRFRAFGYRVSQNHTRTCWVLQCDIRKFFASIDHDILNDIIAKHIPDSDTLWLLSRIISSFFPGLPLGNLTSQLMVNIYMNEFDQWVKHALKVKHYIRYADDFAILHGDKSYLQELLSRIGDFLQEKLHLDLHPHKVSLRTLASGIDFLGWAHFPDHRVLRMNTKRRMFRRLRECPVEATRQSYRGLLGHGNTYNIRESI
ncbi:MAG: reverse transcriptase/maturase family protein [Patescibacteria group bacterium]